MEDHAYERGLALRRRMFGPQAMDDQVETSTDFSHPLQEFVTRACFGDLWHRPHLDLKIRSMVTIAMLAALGRSTQIKMHVVGALANGVSKNEIREILLHAAFYGGLPAAAESFAATAEAFAEIERVDAALSD